MPRRQLARFARRAVHVLLLVAVVGSLLPALPARPAEAADPPVRFGIAEAFWAHPESTALGVTWERLVFNWSAMQPDGPDSWNVHAMDDRILSQARDNNREVVGVMIGCAKWACADGRDVPPGIGLSPDDPNNQWARYAKRLASTYKGRIKTWVVWNEPDIWNRQQPDIQFYGSVGDYYQLLKTSYQAIKSVDPGAQVAMAGTTYWWDKKYGREIYLRQLLNLAKADPTAAANNMYFDVVPVHLYNDPLNVYETLMAYREILGEYGLVHKPLWLMETNAAIHDDPESPLPRMDQRANRDEQAAYMIQASAAALAADVRHVGVYKSKDLHWAPGGFHYGLIKPDGAKRPAYDAYRTAIRLFSDVTAATISYDNRPGGKPADPIVKVDTRAPGRYITVVWNRSPEPRSVTVGQVGPATLVDRMGNEQAISAGPNGYTLNLPGATHNTDQDDPARYLIGGGPLVLVQQTANPPALGPKTPSRLLRAYAPSAPSRLLERPVAPTQTPGSASYAEAAGGRGRYVIADEGGIGFWNSFNRLGGVDALGYPSSGRFQLDGFTYQAAQGALLQWRPELGRAVLANTFEMLQDAGKDGWLSEAKGIPAPIADDGSGGDWERAKAARLSWLTNDAIKAKYLSAGSVERAIELYGLPMSKPEKRGPFVVQRFQRIAFQLWVEDVPGMPARGSVVRVLGGDLAKEAGLVPASAAQPQP